MTPVPPVRTLALLLVAFLILSAPAKGQDPFPSASGPGAEADWAVYDALLARDPDDVEARFGLARTLAVSQDFAGAIAQYKEVLVRSLGLRSSTKTTRSDD